MRKKKYIKNVLIKNSDNFVKKNDIKKKKKLLKINNNNKKNINNKTFNKKKLIVVKDSIIDKVLSKTIITEVDNVKIVRFKKGRFSLIEYYKHKSPLFAAFLDFLEKAEETIFRVKK
jgi:hypothetical protein